MRGRLEGAKDTFENNTAILKRAEVSCKFCYDGTDIMMGQDKKGTGRDGILLLWDKTGNVLIGRLRQ
jgi:hypothetical protein